MYDFNIFFRFNKQLGGKHSSSSGGNFNTLGNNEDYEDEYDHEEEYYDEAQQPNQQNQQNQQHHQIHQQHSSQQQGYRPPASFNANSNVNVDQRFKHYNRLRRDLPNFNDLELRNRLACNRSQCAIIRCTTSQLDTDSSAWIALRMRLVTQTVNLVCILIDYLLKFNFIYLELILII